MKTLLVVLNLVAFVLSFGAIAWAWYAVHKDVQNNRALMERLKAIDVRYANGGRERTDEKFAEYRRAGKTMFTYNDLQHMPELVKDLIYRHAAGGLGPQVVLVGLGLLVGTVANIWSLFL